MTIQTAELYTTEQEAFDAVALWLLRKDATQCIDEETGNCVYGIYELTRNENAPSSQCLTLVNACGIGGILEDGLRQRIVFGDLTHEAGKGVKALIENIPELAKYSAVKNILSTLQTAHDTKEHWGADGKFNANGVLMLAQIANDYNLSLYNVRYVVGLQNNQ